MATLRDMSRKNWTGTNLREEIAVGSLQRIADATEKMAQSYEKIISDRDTYCRLYKNECECSERLARSNAALRGVITKLKRTAKEGE